MDQLCEFKDRFLSSTVGKVMKLGFSLYIIVDMVTDAMNTKKFGTYAMG